MRGNNDRVGWGWKNVLPHFRQMEGNNRLSNDSHGTQGPILVSDPGYIDGYLRWSVQAVQTMGEPFNPDFNGPSQRGVGFYQFTNRHGKRSSAAYAFLSPQQNNPNLVVRLQAEVQKIVLDGTRAVSVVYNDKSGVHEVRANSEIILAAGALVTPKVLMLSGIGPSDELAKHGIKALVDLQGVGQNLIDHPEVPIIALANSPYGYFKQGNGWRMIRNGLQFKLFGSGPITSSGLEAGAFVNPSDPSAPPTIQAFCVPIVYLDRDLLTVMKEDFGLTVTTVLVKPKSRGYVKLRSANAADMPLVSHHLLKDPADMSEMIAGQRFFLKAFEAEPLAKRISRVIYPKLDDLSDEALRAHCKRFVKTNYHPVGTARMGADGDPLAVLDSRLRVRGVEGLRVCDMSAVPNINAGNTNAPAMMLGDRCADLVMGKL